MPAARDERRPGATNGSGRRQGGGRAKRGLVARAQRSWTTFVRQGLDSVRRGSTPRRLFDPPPEILQAPLGNERGEFGLVDQAG